MEITGTVTHQDLEGGFWGIEGDDGVQYRPIEPLPDAVRHDGCRVRAAIEPVTVLSIAMWGRSVRVDAIQRI